MKVLLGLCVTAAVLLGVIPGYADDRSHTQPLGAYRSARKTRHADEIYNLLRSVQQADTRTDSETDIEELLDEVRRYDNLRKAIQPIESRERGHREIYYGDWRKASNVSTSTTSTTMTPPERPPPATTLPTTTTTQRFTWSWPHWGGWKRSKLPLERRRRLLIEAFRKLAD